MTEIEKSGYVNASIKSASSIQILLPKGNYEVVVDVNKSLMHVYSLQKLQEIDALNFEQIGLSMLSKDYMVIKKCQIQHYNEKHTTDTDIQSKPKPTLKPTAKKLKGPPPVWTEKDKQIMKEQCEAFEELAEMHDDAAALYQSREKKLFV